jgi:hypothetical protein
MPGEQLDENRYGRLVDLSGSVIEDAAEGIIFDGFDVSYEPSNNSALWQSPGRYITARHDENETAIRILDVVFGDDGDYIHNSTVVVIANEGRLTTSRICINGDVIEPSKTGSLDFQAYSRTLDLLVDLKLRAKPNQRPRRSFLDWLLRVINHGETS